MSEVEIVFFLKILIYLRERQNRDREREKRELIHWFTLQMSTKAGFGQGDRVNLEAGNSVWMSNMGGKKPTALGHHFCISGLHHQEAGIRSQNLGTETRHSHIGHGMLTVLC